MNTWIFFFSSRHTYSLPKKQGLELQDPWKTGFQALRQASLPLNWQTVYSKDCVLGNYFLRKTKTFSNIKHKYFTLSLIQTFQSRLSIPMIVVWSSPDVCNKLCHKTAWPCLRWNSSKHMISLYLYCSLFSIRGDLDNGKFERERGFQKQDRRPR